MSEFKGTKGRWTVNSYDNTLVTPATIYTNEGICRCFSRNYTGHKFEDQANALLISKAPEMLETLKQAQSELRRIKSSMMAHPDCTEGSEFDDYTSSAERVENEIENLIKEATTI